MTPDKLPPPKVIDTLEELEWLAGHLGTEERLAVDMESNGFYVYHERVCLLQLSTGIEDFVVDPLAVKDLSPLGPIFRDPKVEKVFHAGEYDILCLKRDYGFKVKTIFDTMVAVRTLGALRLGLARAIEKYFGIKLSKKLQRANWGERPLSRERIQYARLDTHYLLPLRDILHRKLEEKGLLKDAIDDFRRLEKIEPTVRIFDPESFWSLQGARNLTPQKRAALRELYIFRERKAAEMDKAPFRVLPEELLVRVADEDPVHIEALRRMKGMTPYLLRKFGKELLKTVEESRSLPPVVKPPERTARRWDGQTLRRYEALRQWRKEQADKRGLHPVVVLATDEVKRIAEAPKKDPDPSTWLDSLSDYKAERYGQQILAILKEPRPPKHHKRRKP